MRAVRVQGYRLTGTRNLRRAAGCLRKIAILLTARTVFFAFKARYLVQKLNPDVPLTTFLQGLYEAIVA